MKKITITGKKTVDDLMVKKNKRVRVYAKEQYLSDVDLEHTKQIEVLNNLKEEKNNAYKEIMLTELERKINGYKQQDIKKGIFDINKLISLDEIITKLSDCSLNCHYCKKEVKVLYRVVREPRQWTLDRIDNDLCHSNSNTLVSCLTCNLKRRLMDKDKFEFTKQLHLTKVNNLIDL